MAWGMDGFSDDGLVAGSVFGARWFTLNDRTGVLEGQVRPWKPGENTAECTRGSGMDPVMDGDTGRQREHGPIPDPDCGCGYWAYWAQTEHNGMSDKARPVLAVVEGYGDVITGPKGFRAAKAKIVAACPRFLVEMPDPDGQPPLAGEKHGPGALDRLFHRGPPGNGAATFAALGGGGGPAVRMVPDLATQAKIEVELGERYACAVYASPKLMLREHPLTEGYGLHAQDCVCEKCLEPLMLAVAEFVAAVKQGAISHAEGAAGVRDLMMHLTIAQAASDASAGRQVSTNAKAALTYLQNRYAGMTSFGVGSSNGGSGGGGGRGSSGNRAAPGGGGGGSGIWQPAPGGGPLFQPVGYGSSPVCAHPPGQVCSNCAGGGLVAAARSCCASLDNGPHTASCALGTCPYCGGDLTQGRHDLIAGCSTGP